MEPIFCPALVGPAGLPLDMTVSPPVMVRLAHHGCQPVMSKTPPRLPSGSEIVGGHGGRVRGKLQAILAFNEIDKFAPKKIQVRPG